MALRLLEIILPEENMEAFRKLIKDEQSIVGFWQEHSAEDNLLVKIMLPAEKTEAVLDELEKRYTHLSSFRVLMLPVEATLPRIEEKKPDENQKSTTPAEDNQEKKSALRISREELYSEISDGVKFNYVFVAMVILSSIVASIGLVRDNVAVVIGAMVIAPLLGPNVGLALATTLADLNLGKKALRTNLLGVLIALAFSIALGYLVEMNVLTKELLSRTQVHLSDIVLALASGIAGVLAFTSGVSAALIGVMVAVALLPPLVTFGLMLGSGNFQLASGALLLLLTNLICVNLAGVSTFLVMGIRPRSWWEANKAKKATRWALILWTFGLVMLAIVIFLSERQ